MDFVKIEALGNDYIYVDANAVKGCDLPSLARQISNRRLGVGADGLITVEKITNSTIRMAMYNADGSEGAMCGNGVRGSTFFAYKNLGMKSNKIRVLTKSREVFVSLKESPKSNNLPLKQIRLTADMGVVSSGKNTLIIVEELAKVGLYVDKRQVLHVNVGNPHLVFFEPNYSLTALTSAVSRSGLFPDGINVERVFKIKNKSENESSLFMEVHERGSGKTLSCGSGAVAAAYAFSVYSYRPLDAKLKVGVTTEGGTLSVFFEGGKAFLSGEVREVFSGAYDESHFLENNDEIKR